MYKEQADQVLAGVGAAHDRIAGAMYAIDSHPGLSYLRSGAHTGSTTAAWTSIKPQVDALWAQFFLLGDRLERARSIRAAHRPTDPEWAELAALLTGAVTGLDVHGMPVPPSGPPPAPPRAPSRYGISITRWGYPQPTTWSVGYPPPPGQPGAAWPPPPYPRPPTRPYQPQGPPGFAPGASALRLGELAGRMEVACAAMNRTLSEVNAAWTAASLAAGPLTEATNAMEALARELADPGAVARASARTASIRDEVTADPLRTAPAGVLHQAWRGGIAKHEAEVAAITAHLRDQVRMRDAYPQRLAEINSAIDTVAAAEARTSAAFARAAEKITDTGLPPVPDSAPVLRHRVSELDSAYADARAAAASGTPVAGAWGQLVRDAELIEAQVTRAGERAAELIAAADGLLGRRDELRGRLEAYRAKAAEHRLDEHEELSGLHTEARDLLYTAPCDLPSATRAVFAYQRALAGLLEAGDGRKGTAR